MANLARIASQLPFHFIVLIICVLGPALVAARYLEIDVSSRALTAHNATAPVSAGSKAGGDRLVVLLQSKSGTPIAPDIVRRLEQRLGHYALIDRSSIFSVLSFADLTVGDATLFFRSRLAPDGGASSHRRRGDLHGIAVSSDRTATLLMATFNRNPSLADIAAVRHALQEAAGGDNVIRIGGDAFAQAELASAILADLLVLGPIAALLLMFVVWRHYGSLALAVVVLGEAAVSMALLLGLMAALGEPVTIVTVILPVILFTSGVVDDVYFIDRVLRMSTISTDRSEAVFVAARLTIRPVWLGTAAAVAGILPLAWCGMPAFESLARLGVLAVLISFVATFVLMPALLALLSSPAIDNAALTIRTRYVRAGTLLRCATARNAHEMMGLGLVIVVAGVCAARGLPINDSWLHNLPNGETRETSEFADRYLSGASIAEIEIGFPGPLAWTAQSVSRLIQLADEVRQVPKVQVVWSPAEELANLRALFNHEAEFPSGHRGTGAASKMTADEVDQFALLLASGTVPFMSSAQIRQADSVPLVISVTDADARTLRQIRDTVYTIAAANAMTVTLKGPIWRSLDTVDVIVRTSTEAVLEALLLVAIVVAIVTRSWRLAVAGTLTISMALAAIYIGLWLLDASLGIATALFAPLALGFGANAVAHFIAEFEEADLHLAERTAQSILNAMPASVTGSIATIAGFSVLLLSRIPPNQALARLVIASLLVSTAATALFAPVFVLKFYEDHSCRAA